MMASPLRIAVLAAIGRNPVSGFARPNPDDVVALELARGLGDDVTVLHAGDGTEAAISDYFAYGATRLDVVPASAGNDVTATLAERLAGFDLLLTGSRSEGGEGSGLVPYLVAERLGLPIVGQALGVTVADGHAEVTQFMPKGQRRKVRVRLPAVIAVHPMAPVTPRYAYARRVAGRIVQQPAPQPTTPSPVAWHVAPATKKPVKFKAAETKAGHARMLSAIVTEAKGGAVVNTGTPADKAQAILAYLREHRLIDW
jgi:electron transfer flavoprotein beta subunit